MATTIIKFAFVLSLVALLAACTEKKCIGPTCAGGIDPAPNQDGLDPLGEAAPKYYLRDAAGNTTVMWVRLLEVSPVRRSVITFGNEVCPAKCQRFLIQAGMDVDSNATTPAVFEVNWSPNCQTPLGDSLTGGTVQQGQTVMIGQNFTTFFRDFAPQCFYVSGRYSQKDTLVKKEGSFANTKLEYKLP